MTVFWSPVLINLTGPHPVASVMDLRLAPAIFTGPIKDSLPSIRAGASQYNGGPYSWSVNGFFSVASFCIAGWVTGVKKDSILVSKAYLEAIRNWVYSFPDHARKMIPDEELGRYIGIQNAQFMKVDVVVRLPCCSALIIFVRLPKMV